MNVLAVSTYPPIECGIATYTQWLRQSLTTADIDVTVVAPPGATGPGVFPIYEANSPSSLQLIRKLLSRTPTDVVHIQHEYGLFGPDRGRAVLDLIDVVRSEGRPLVTTLHTVHSALDTLQCYLLKRLIEESTRIIVHEEFQRNYIVQSLQVPPSKIDVIEHGIRLVQQIPDAKKRLGMAGRKVVLMCGYIRPRKAFHKIVDILPQVVSEEPTALLTIAAKLRRPTEFMDYRDILMAQIANSPCTDHVRVIEGQLPHDELDLVISAADVVVLPYEQGAQSGILANALAFGRAVVSSDLAAFQAIVSRSGAGIVARTQEEFARAILAILSNSCLRATFESNGLRYARQVGAWDAVAKSHRRTYALSLAPGKAAAAETS